MNNNVSMVTTEQALTVADIVAQRERVLDVMKNVMRKGVHYGVIPGCGDKPVILLPGVDLLLSTFRINADPEIENVIRTDDSYMVRVRAVASTMDGRRLGSATGEASTNEEKYKWRKATCKEEYEATDPDRRRVKFKKAKDSVYQEQQVRTNPSDVSNTVLKMAFKRAKTSISLQVTAASDIFAVDLDTLTPEMAESLVGHDEERPTIKPPQAKTSATTDASASSATQDTLPTGDAEPVISEGKSKRLYAIAMGKGMSKEALGKLCFSHYGSTRTDACPVSKYDAVVADAEAFKP